MSINDIVDGECDFACTMDVRSVCATPPRNIDPALFEQFNNECALDKHNCGKTKGSYRRFSVIFL